MPIQNLITALQTNYDTLENQYNIQRGFYGATQTENASMPNSVPASIPQNLTQEDITQFDNFY